MKVSLVTTVKDAAGAIDAFLASLAGQTRSDGTLERLRAAGGITLIEEPGANIARGRNLAIAAAAHDVVAVTDADCVLEPEWLERLLEPIEAGADVAMGFYRPIAGGFLPVCMAAVNLPDVEEVDEATFMPSSRSVAFRREAIEAVGGYPEWLDIGEDMYVNHAWRARHLQLRFAPRAVVRWRLRTSLRETWTQYFRYARGDAIAGMHAERHALRFGVYGAAAYAWGSRGRLRKLATIAGGAAYVARPLRRAWSRFEDPAERAAALAAVPALMAFTDAAKMSGFLAGISARRDRTSPLP